MDFLFMSLWEEVVLVLSTSHNFLRKYCTYYKFFFELELWIY